MTAMDVNYEMVLSNFAKIHYFGGLSNQPLPSDFTVTTGTMTATDTTGITAGGTFGAPHGIIAPTVMLPYTRVSQGVWTVVPTARIDLLQSLQLDYYLEIAKSKLKLNYGQLNPSGRLTGHYRDLYAWVDDDQIPELNKFVAIILGAPAPSGWKNVERKASLSAIIHPTANTLNQAPVVAPGVSPENVPNLREKQNDQAAKEAVPQSYNTLQ